MQYLKYLQYIPLLLDLVGFIRDAERTYRDAGSSAQKLSWVSSQFTALVTRIERQGVLSPKLAAALRDGSEAIISIIVQAMNAGGGVPVEKRSDPVEERDE